MEPFYLLVFLLFLALVFVFLFIQKQQFAALPNGKNTATKENVSKDLYVSVIGQLEIAKEELREKEQHILTLNSQLASSRQQVLHLEEALKTGKSEIESARQQMQVEFENIANRLLEERGRSLNEHSHRQLHNLLLPLRERIKDFEDNIEKKFLEETREKSSLKKEIEQLHQLNQQLSTDANNLASALKGSSKVQGSWGEYQLELLLEKAGLIKGTHFLTQNSYRDENGRLKRPDFVIHLPENRQLIVDAKVSLTAFERFYTTDDPEQRETHLKQHVESLRRHVQSLSSKEYQMLSDLHVPDYTLLFVPIESALTIAAQSDPRLFTDALEQNVVLVSTGSLLSTLRTVSHIWKQEKQAHSVQEIARQSGLLYDKFVAFVEDLKMIGLRLQSAQNAYDSALNKLVNSPRQGDTLVGRAERIRALGAKTSKQLPEDMVAEAVEEV